MSRMSNAALKFDDDEQPLPPAPLTTGGDGGGAEDEEEIWWEGHVVLAGPRFPLIRRFLPPRKRRRTKTTAVQMTFDF